MVQGDGSEEEDVEVVEQVCSQLFTKALKTVPGSVRIWFSDLGKHSSQIERYTSLVISPKILKQEFADVRQGDHKDMKIRAAEKSREVISSISVEDGGSSIDLYIRLPECYPLKPAKVEFGGKIVIAEQKLRKWLLSIDAYLRNHNGSVLEAVSKWKKNVDKEFEGYEECLICYSVALASNGSLPTMKCRTCAVNYHPSCLYKWFTQSNKSSCPHCQSPW